MKRIKKIASFCLSIIYFPLYLCAFLLHAVSRLLLAISYFGLLERRMAVDILNSIFNTNYGRKQTKNIRK